MTTALKPFDNALLLIEELPGDYSFDHCWAMPRGVALRRIADLLGEGSQAFIFSEMTFGDPNDSDHNHRWHEFFHTQITAAWEGETPPLDRGGERFHLQDPRRVGGGRAVVARALRGADRRHARRRVGLPTRLAEDLARQRAHRARRLAVPKSHNNKLWRLGS